MVSTPMAEILPCLKFVALLLVVHPCTTLEVHFLQENNRSNSYSIVDFYFSCSAVGQTLQWSVNKLGLGGFFTGSNAGDLLTSSRPNFTYSSSLLSKEPSGHSQVNFTSVLVVSVQHRLHLEVACRTEAEQEIIMNSGNITNSNPTHKNGESVFLQHVLNQVNVGYSQNISLFLCEADGLSMTWHASANYPFVSDDVIGANWLELFSGSGSRKIVKEQAILIAHQPRPFVSLLIVTNYTGNTITCGSNQDSVQLPTSTVINSNHYTVITSDVNTESLESSTSEISTQVHSVASSTVIEYDKRINAIILVVYNLVVVVLIAINVTSCVIIISKKCRKCFRHKYNLKGRNNSVHHPVELERNDARTTVLSSTPNPKERKVAVNLERDLEISAIESNERGVDQMEDDNDQNEELENGSHPNSEVVTLLEGTIKSDHNYSDYVGIGSSFRTHRSATFGSSSRNPSQYTITKEFPQQKLKFDE